MEAHVPPRVYLAVYVALLALLGLTMGLSRLHLGTWNAVLSLAIAAAKAVLVALFFMHLKYSSKLIGIFAAAGFFWLGILLVLSMTDYYTR